MESEAARCYQQASEIESNEFRWLYYLGRSLHKSDPGRAADAFARAIAIDARYAPVNLYYAYVLRSLKRFEEAQRHLNRVEELEPQNAYSELGLGELALANKNFEAARAHLQQALAQNPQQSEAHAALAKIYMALGNKESARQHALLASEPTKHKPLPDALWNQVVMAGATTKWFVFRGRLALREADYPGAFTELKEAISDEQQDAKIWLDYSAALLGIKRYQEAIAAAEKALALMIEDKGKKRLPPGDIAMIYNNLGLAYEQLGEVKFAEQHLQKAMSVNLTPDSQEKKLAENNLMALYIRAGANDVEKNQLVSAERNFRKALELDPQSVLVMNNLAVVYRFQGRLVDAVEVLKSSLEVQYNPSTVRMLDILTWEANISGGVGRIKGNQQ